MIPKKITPFCVRVKSGRFEGVTGNAVHLYNDGVYGIDTDKGERAFAKEEQIERLEGKPEGETK